MAEVLIGGGTSGTVSLRAPDLAGTTVLTLPAASGTLLTQNSISPGGISITASALGTVAGNQTQLLRTTNVNSNAEYLEITSTRTANGSDWTTAGIRLQEKIDFTWMGYLQFNGSGNLGGVSIGTGTTTVGPTSILERMRIDGNGAMLRPYHPAFMVYGTDLPVIGSFVTYGAAAEFNIGPNGVHYNAGNGYSTATGRFTAPVTGLYSFSYGTYSAVATACQLSIKKNGITWAPSDSIGLCTIQSGTIAGTTVYIYLTANDFVSYGWRAGYSGQIYHPHSWFAGHLIG